MEVANNYHRLARLTGLAMLSHRLTAAFNAATKGGITMCDSTPNSVEYNGETHCWWCNSPLNEESRDGYCSLKCYQEHMEEEVAGHMREYHGSGCDDPE